MVQFPPFYPDELVYSLLARYYARSGYLRYTFAAEELFERKTARPDAEFVNRYTDAAIRMMTQDDGMGHIITHHTMFHHYGRFLPADRRQKAFDSLVGMQGDHRQLLPMPKSKKGEKRCLRYCPECVKADREKRGETYWHRVHQIPEIRLCPIHKCYLVDSYVFLSGKASPDLVTAELAVDVRSETVYCENTIEKGVSEYVAQVFEADLDMASTVGIGEFLHSQMAGTPYRSVRGEQRNIALFQKDFMQYYRDLEGNEFTEIWQMQKILNGYRYNSYEICLMAMFLQVPVPDLVQMALPEKTQEQAFDETVLQLHRKGMKYPEIARRLNAPYDTVKAIGEKKYKKETKKMGEKHKGGRKGYDWAQIDQDTLPEVKAAIRQLLGDGETRPRKVTVHAVEKLLGLPCKRISLYLPLCRAEIGKHQEAQEEYWAREIAWAVKKMQREGQPVNWKRIRNLTNLRRKDFKAALVYISRYSDQSLGEQLKYISQ